MRTRRVKQSRSGMASPLDCFVASLLAMTGEQRTGNFCWTAGQHLLARGDTLPWPG
ncbi:MAG: hypothetical protein LBT00_03160 [Spirochaetaceae bacterium]|nr:hypothetical protein [Spirochaetaceae bacterium]